MSDLTPCQMSDTLLTPLWRLDIGDLFPHPESVVSMCVCLKNTHILLLLSGTFCSTRDTKSGNASILLCLYWVLVFLWIPGKDVALAPLQTLVFCFWFQCAVRNVEMPSVLVLFWWTESAWKAHSGPRHLPCLESAGGHTAPGSVRMVHSGLLSQAVFVRCVSCGRPTLGAFEMVSSWGFREFDLEERHLKESPVHPSSPEGGFLS